MSRTVRPFDTAVWAAQWIVAVAFNFVGMAKLGFTGEQARPFFGGAAITTEMLHTVGMVEIALALAAILPAVLRILPQLSTVAAGALAAVALLGAIMPASAAGATLPLVDIALVAAALFVVWGRSAFAPIAPFAEETDEFEVPAMPRASSIRRPTAPPAQPQFGARSRSAGWPGMRSIHDETESHPSAPSPDAIAVAHGRDAGPLEAR